MTTIRSKRLPPALLTLVLVAAVSLALAVPALIQGNVLGGDTPVHVRWHWQFADQVWHGTLYPRWLPGNNSGFGSPAYFFYPPLIQWVGALFYPMFPGRPDAMVRLILAVWAISVFGAMGARLWLRALGLRQGIALFGALVFALIPYRSYFDFYQRGATPELAGISMIPWMLFFATRLQDRLPGGWSGYALSVAGILFSHLPAADFGIPFATAYIVVLARGRDLRAMVNGATATVTGFLVAAICVATAIGLLRYITDPTAMWGTRNQPVNWLLFSAKPWIDPVQWIITVVLSAFAIGTGAVCTWLSRRDPDARLRRIALFFLASILLVFLLNTALSRPFWALQTPLSRIQFPFRLIGIDDVAVTGLLAIALHAAEHSRLRDAAVWRRLLWLAVPALVVLDAGFIAIQDYRNIHTRQMTNAQMTASDEDTSEYVLGRLDLVRPHFGAAPTWTVQGAARTHALGWASRHVWIAVEADAPSTLALRQFAFTGWECRVDGGAWSRGGTIPYPLNLPTCTVPAGHHVLEGRLPATPIERIGNILTAIGLALVAIAYAIDRRRVRRADPIQF